VETRPPSKRRKIASQKVVLNTTPAVEGVNQNPPGSLLAALQDLNNEGKELDDEINQIIQVLHVGYTVSLPSLTI